MSNLLCLLLRRWRTVKQPSCRARNPPSALYLLPFRDNHNDQFVRLTENLTEVAQHSARLDAVVLQRHSPGLGGSFWQSSCHAGRERERPHSLFCFLTGREVHSCRACVCHLCCPNSGIFSRCEELAEQRMLHSERCEREPCAFLFLERGGGGGGDEGSEARTPRSAPPRGSRTAGRSVKRPESPLPPP